MFIGHFATALATKKAAPKISLGTTFMATQFIDLLWPLFLLSGIEKAEINPAHKMTPIDFTYYPYTHSLLFVCLWALLFAGIHFAFRRDKKNALILGCLVLSHWFLDLIVHRPDLPLLPDGPFAGMGLWNVHWASFAFETALFLAAAFLYYRSTRALNQKGRWVTAVLMALLLVIHIANTFGPPPPSIMAVAYAGNLTWIFVALAFWADRNRTAHF